MGPHPDPVYVKAEQIREMDDYATFGEGGAR